MNSRNTTIWLVIPWFWESSADCPKKLSPLFGKTGKIRNRKQEMGNGKVEHTFHIFQCSSRRLVLPTYGLHVRWHWSSYHGPLRLQRGTAEFRMHTLFYWLHYTTGESVFGPRCAIVSFTTALLSSTVAGKTVYTELCCASLQTWEFVRINCNQWCDNYKIAKQAKFREVNYYVINNVHVLTKEINKETTLSKRTARKDRQSVWN